MSLTPGKVLANTAYDSDENRAYCAHYGIQAVTPSYPSRVKHVEIDEETYRDRNRIECFLAA